MLDASVVGSTDLLVGGLTTDQIANIGAEEVTVDAGDLANIIGSTDPLVGGLTTDQIANIGAAEIDDDDDDITKTTTTTVTDNDDPEPPETPEPPEDILFALGEQQFEDVIETTVTPAELLAILGAENTDTITTHTAPTLTAALSGSSEASSGGAGSLLVPQQRVVPS